MACRPRHGLFRTWGAERILYVVMVYIVMAYTGMAYIVMTYIVMANIAMARQTRGFASTSARPRKRSFSFLQRLLTSRRNEPRRPPRGPPPDLWRSLDPVLALGEKLSARAVAVCVDLGPFFYHFFHAGAVVWTCSQRQ